MKVGADGIGEESLLDGAACNGPEEASAAVSDVEEHSTLAGFDHPWLDLACEAVDEFHLPVVIHMGVNVAGAQMLQQLCFGGSLRVGENLVVHHDGNTCAPSGFDGAIDG